MTARSMNTGYGKVAVGLHWGTAVLVLGQMALGLSMARVAGGDSDGMYRAHVAIGLVIGLLTLARIAWRVIEPSPTPPPMPAWRLRLYQANHAAFYVVLLALAASGIALLLASDLTLSPTGIEAEAVEDGRARDGHFILALIFSALFFMHVAGVVSYQRTKGDVFARIGVTGLNSPDHTPTASGRE